MPKLRRIIWDNGKPSIGREDYEVIDERGERIGRMYRTIAGGGAYAWNWTVHTWCRRTFMEDRAQPPRKLY